MKEKTKKGYVAGVVSLFVFLFFGLFAVHNEFNLTGQILWVITFVFGVFGFGSLWKPDSVGQIVWQILENFSESDKDTSDSHNKQIQKNSSGSVQAMSTHGNINISMNSKENVNSKDLEVYSLIHAMIIRVNKSVPREAALQLTTGAWVKESVMDFDKISALFNQHSDKFRDKDLDMWLDIENELKNSHGFFLGKDRQEWFDYLEAEYKRRKKGGKS